MLQNICPLYFRPKAMDSIDREEKRVSNSGKHGFYEMIVKQWWWMHGTLLGMGNLGWL